MKKPALRRPVFAPTPQALAQRGADALGQARFKEAAEVFKQLLRDDPKPEWAERLADAYAGRARELAAKGMFKEAAIVLENTLSSGGTIREPLLYLSCLIRQDQHQKARRVALESIARLPPAEAARLADCAAVLSLAVPVPEATPSGDETWAEQSRAAQAALHAWLQGSPPDEVDRLLGSIPLRSPFGPMRLILKSLLAPPGDGTKAKGLLAMIPAESRFAGVRAAAEAALAEDRDLCERWNQLRPAQQQFVGEVRGLQQGGAVLLNQMLEAEQRGPASLFNFLTRRELPLAEHDLRTACLNLLPAIPERLPEFERRFGPLTALDHNRVLALGAEAKGSWDSAAHYWYAAIKALEREAAPESRLAQAVVLRHMADLARAHPGSWFDPHEPEADDPVAHYLERSIEADPDFLPATLALLDRYRTAEDKKDWYRAAEAAAERFPANATVLLHAVDAAVARNAYKKAVGFARQVLRVDPINLPVRQRMIELQLAYARKQMRSGRADLAGKGLLEAAEWERPDRPSGALRIGRALVRMASAQANDAEDAVRAAVQDAGGVPVGWFQVMLEAALMGLPEKHLQPFQHDLSAARQSAADHTSILALVGLLGQKEIRDSRKTIAPVLRRISGFLTSGSRIAWTPAEFQTIAELLVHLREFRVLHRYAQDAMQRGSNDPAVGFYRIAAGAQGNRNRLSALEEAHLYDMLEQAMQRQDFPLFNRVQRFLLGPEGTRAMRKMALSGAEQEELDEVDTSMLLEALIGELPKMPAKDVRAMVNQLGLDGSIDMLAAEMADSPLGDVLSEEQIRQLCTSMITGALEDTSPHPRRARRR